ncbi:glycogen/starch synthase [Flavitalea flava]
MILHLTSEVAPFYKRGGLGDISGTLPRYLNASLPNVVISFFYEEKMKKTDFSLGGVFSVYIHGAPYEFTYYSDRRDQVDFYFLNMADPFVFADLEDGERPYRGDASFFVYLYFAKAALKLVDILQLYPGYIIFHDWHVCGCFAFQHELDELKEKYNAFTILLIHNYDYQGEILPDVFHLLDEEVLEQVLPVFSRYGRVTLLSLGLKHADYVATVSEGYAEELRRKSLPHAGLEFLDLIKKRKIYALPNGIDREEWSPDNNRFIHFPYNRNSVSSGKQIAKNQVEKKFGIMEDDGPIVLLMARLTEQKGITLLMDFWGNEESSLVKIGAVLDTGIKLIVCGQPSGGLNGNTHRRFTLASKHYPGKFVYEPGYNEALANLLLAAADVLLCPSLFEPCGLVHIYGMAFGTIPVVRPVGGLRDTVIPFTDSPETCTGFYIDSFSHHSLVACLREVVHVFRHRKEEWKKITGRCMDQDFSWEKTRVHYFEFFDHIREGQLIETPQS